MTQISPKVERKVAMVDQDQTVLEAARVMVERYIGSVVVTGDSQVRGIFTERDLMRVVAQQQNPVGTKLRDVMRKEIVRASPHDSIEHCLRLMRTHRCRHLLVFEKEDCIGIISLRDLATLMIEEKEALVEQLTKYITS